VETKSYDVIVIGAGPAGLMASGKAAEQGASVLLLEKMNKPGRKLLITGNGRCNLTNAAPMAEFIKHIGPESRFVRNAFSKFFSGDLVSFFEKLGVPMDIEDDEFYFTRSNRAADVVNALVIWCEKLGVNIRCKASVKEIKQEQGGFEILVTDENAKEYSVLCKSLVIACGGASYPATGSSGDGYKWFKNFGHKITPIRPALVPLETFGDTAQRLQGLSLPKAQINVWVDGRKKTAQKGDMLFTHFGITGPLVHSLSRVVIDDIQKGRSVVFSIDLLSEISENEIDNYLIQLLEKSAKKKIENFLDFLMPPKLIPVCIDITGIGKDKNASQLSSAERKKLRLWLKDFKLEIKGSRSFAEAMVTSGGVALNEINPETMESKLVKNLFIAGEILDLDADTGGYNLQIAFSTGFVAGMNAAAVK
jgi:predicted Rossmann fold flavoprotein